MSQSLAQRDANRTPKLIKVLREAGWQEKKERTFIHPQYVGHTITISPNGSWKQEHHEDLEGGVYSRGHSIKKLSEAVAAIENNDLQYHYPGEPLSWTLPRVEGGKTWECPAPMWGRFARS